MRQPRLKSIQTLLLFLLLVSLSLVLSAGCQGALLSSAPASTPTAVSSTPSLETESPKATATPLNVELARKNERFVPAIAQVTPGGAGMEILLYIMRGGTSEIVFRDGSAVSINPDGTTVVWDRDWVLSAANLRARPIPGTSWSTKALVLVRDKNGNQFPMAGSAVDKSTGSAIVSWDAGSPTVQPLGLLLIGAKTEKLDARAIINNISSEIQQMQQPLDQAYELAKKKAMSDAQKGLPYVEPDPKQFYVTQEQYAVIASRYIDITVVPFIESKP